MKKFQQLSSEHLEKVVDHTKSMLSKIEEGIVPAEYNNDLILYGKAVIKAGYSMDREEELKVMGYGISLTIKHSYNPVFSELSWNAFTISDCRTVFDKCNED